MSATKAAAARPDISILGVVTKDLQHLPGAPDRAAPGGVPIYAGLALCALGLRVEVRTRLASRDAALLAGLRAAGADIEIRPARATTQFENLYSGGDLGTRRQRVQAQAGPFAIVDLRGLRASAVHLGPLLPDDLPLAVLRALRSRATLISLDVQGYARRLVDGEVRSADWPDKRAGLACIDILKADAEEAEALTGQRDPGRAARALAALGPREVLVTLGAAGSLLLAQGRLHRVPAYRPRAVVDPTGCGDSYCAGYLFRRLQGAAPDAAARFGAALATAKIEQAGPFTGSADAVAAILKLRETTSASGGKRKPRRGGRSTPEAGGRA